MAGGRAGVGAKEKTAGHEGHFDKCDPLDTGNVGKRLEDVEAEYDVQTKGVIEQEGQKARGDREYDREYDGRTDLQLTRGDGPKLLRGVGAVVLDVTNVIREIDATRDGAEGKKGNKRIFQDVGVKKSARGGGSNEDEAVLYPLGNTHARSNGAKGAARLWAGVHTLKASSPCPLTWGGDGFDRRIIFRDND